jgi:hypothetical protein
VNTTHNPSLQLTCGRQEGVRSLRRSKPNPSQWKSKLKYLSLLALTFAACTPARGQQLYSFTNIGDTNGSFAIIDSRISLNSGGSVAFFATLDSGISGVFAGSGGPITTFADSTGEFDSFADDFSVTGPAINDSGIVAFHAALDAGGHGIYTRSGGIGPITTVADTAGPFSAFSAPSINASGTVVFGAGLDAGGYRIMANTAGSAVTVADRPSQFTNLSGSTPSINTSGVIAFVAYPDGGGDGVFTGDSSGTSPVPFELSNGPLNTFSPPTLNSAGTVAFFATIDAGGNANGGVFTRNTSGGALLTVADTSGPYGFFFGQPSISLAGIAFYAGNFAASPITFGIYTGDDPTTDKVIAGGDALFGSTVVGLGQPILNDFGQVAFNYHLADGRQGIAVANVPEPSALVLTCGGAALGLCRRRRSHHAGERGQS